MGLQDVAAFCEKFGRHSRDDAGLVRTGQFQQKGGRHRNLELDTVSARRREKIVD
jgi:hypothetical protein